MCVTKRLAWVTDLLSTCIFHYSKMAWLCVPLFLNILLGMLAGIRFVDKELAACSIEADSKASKKEIKLLKKVNFFFLHQHQDRQNLCDWQIRTGAAFFKVSPYLLACIPGLPEHRTDELYPMHWLAYA